MILVFIQIKYIFILGKKYGGNVRNVVMNGWLCQVEEVQELDAQNVRVEKFHKSDFDFL